MSKKPPTFAPPGYVLDEHEDYERLGSDLGDRRDGRTYVYDDRTVFAVNVALATRRPLLILGDPGTGKSSLAPFVARCLEWRFYWSTISARTQARDLMWEFDALARLSDAQVSQADPKSAERVGELESYVDPRALWWAFDAKGACRRGLPPEGKPKAGFADDPGAGPDGKPAVVLLDEIDKADPDVPNNLLECLGSLQFRIQETGCLVTAAASPLIVITSNGERELPEAFLRRCIVHHLDEHSQVDLEKIAEQHFADRSDVPEGLFAEVAKILQGLRTEARRDRRRMPSTAEYLDAVRACLDLKVKPGHASWSDLERLTLRKLKHDDQEGED